MKRFLSILAFGLFLFRAPPCGAQDPPGYLESFDDPSFLESLFLQDPYFRVDAEPVSDDELAFDEPFDLETAFANDFETEAALLPPGGPIPVIDPANLVQAVLDHAKRLFEILQRATLILQGIQTLENWYLTLVNLEDIPYRDSILGLLDGIGDLYREFEAVRGQFQALSYALENPRPEFDLTFPGWRSLTNLTTGTSYTVQTEAGTYVFDQPLEYNRFQYARTLQVMRQAMETSRRHFGDLKGAEAYLSFGTDSLTELTHGTLGTQQILEMSTAFAAISSQQLIALRNQVLDLTNITLADASFDLNREMQARATTEGLQEGIAEDLRATYGAVLPSAHAAPPVDPFPSWVETQ